MVQRINFFLNQKIRIIELTKWKMLGLYFINLKTSGNYKKIVVFFVIFFSLFNTKIELKYKNK